MKRMFMLCTAAAVLLTANMAWAQEGAEVDKDALKARGKEISKEMDKIRRGLRKNNEEVAALYKQMNELREKIDAKFAELEPKYGELMKERAEIHKKLRPARTKKAGKDRAKKGGKKKGGKKKTDKAE